MAKEVMKKIIEGNETYYEKVDNWEEIQRGQSPKITLITCSDSRVSGHIINKDMVNFVFHIRNIGNQIENNFGSVDYGVQHLRTPILLILGHTDCGAVKASQKDFSKETDEIKKELYPLYFNLMPAVNKNDKDDKKYISRLVQHNVDIQVMDAMNRYTSENTFIVGAVFDMHKHYSDKEGRIIITNINGLTDEDALKGHPLLAAIEENLRDVRVKRL
ncbi:carbonic anhydrase [Candidatus Woesearchaeota archaeon]|nr:carbonic anhydrase [Candidatus Woesearchaeota archaeon]